jgi:hypothetical protein
VSDPADMNSEQSAAGGIVEKLNALRAERPEVVVGAAFVGGVVVAMVLKRLGGH